MEPDSPLLDVSEDEMASEVFAPELDAGSRGVSLVVLETENLHGFRVGRRLEQLGQHASDTAELLEVAPLL